MKDQKHLSLQSERRRKSLQWNKWVTARKDEWLLSLSGQGTRQPLAASGSALLHSKIL